VDRFTITFCRPVFLPGTVQLALGDGEFQVRDAQNTLAAVGTWRSGIGGDAESEAEPELAAATPARRLSRASMAVAMVVD